MLNYVFIALFGWISGIVVNYLADVLPVKRKISVPFCVHCGEPQAFLNYFVWPRRCEKCKKRRKARIWLVEFLFIVMNLWLLALPPENLEFLLGSILLTYFGLVIVIDLEHRLILHSVSLFGGMLGLVIGIILHGATSTILGGIVGFGSMLLLYFLGVWFVRMLARWRNRDLGEEEGIGFGDVNLSGVSGLLLGWPGIVAGLVLTILISGVVSFIYLLLALIGKKYHPSLSLPFGPFIAASAIVLLYI